MEVSPRPAVFLLVLSALAGPLPAAGAQTEVQIRSDLEFAQGLAEDWGFTDLSEEILARVEREAPESMAEELALTKCQIFRAGAKSERRDTARRLELYQKALDAYQDFIDENEFSELLPQAEREFVDTTREFGRALAAEMEEATGAEAEALRETLQERLTAAIDKTGDLIEDLKSIDEPSEAEKVELYKLMLNRGDMLVELGKTQDDGSFSFDQSLQTYEELSLLAGEDNPYGLRAYIGMGNNYLAQGMYADAADFFTFVCDKAIPFDPEVRADWLRGRVGGQQVEPPSASELEQRFLFVELGIPGAVESLSRSGDLERAVEYALYFYNVWKSEGLTLYEGLGHLALLGVGRTLLEAGGYVGGNLQDGEARWYRTFEEMKAEHPSRRNQRSAVDIALDIAKQVKREMAGNVLQIQAQKLIAAALDRPGVKISPAILYDAAEGEYHEGNDAEAVEGFKTLLASLETEDQATRTEFGTRTLYRLGRTYFRQGLDLEAAVSFEEALANWPEDPEYSPYCADYMLRAARAARARAPQDPLLSKLVTDAEGWVQSVGGASAGDIAFNSALKAYESAEGPSDYQQAMSQFEAVPSDAKNHEKAIVYVGICAFKIGEFELAIQKFQDYLENYVKDPENVLSTNAERARRQEASAMATLYWGLAATAIARTGDGSEAAWRRVLEVLDGYEDKFPEQPNYSAVAMYRRLQAHLELGEADQAIAVHAELVKRFPQESSTARASDAIYDHFKAELEAAGDAEARRPILEEMARLKHISNSITPNPQYQSLRDESLHWIELKRWAEAENTLRRILEMYGDAEKYAPYIERNIKPDLGHVLKQERKVAEAVALLEPLKEHFTAQSAEDYALCLTGWAEREVENGQERFVVVPGVATTPEQFAEGEQALVKLLGSLAAKPGKWTDPWYEMKFNLAFAYLRWGQIDSKKKSSAKGQLENLIPDLGRDFGLIESESVRSKYQWLWSQVK